MAIANLIQGTKLYGITSAQETRYKLERKSFSTIDKLLILVCLPLLPVIFLVIMWLACYQDKKAEELGIFD